MTCVPLFLAVLSLAVGILAVLGGLVPLLGTRLVVVPLLGIVVLVVRFVVVFFEAGELEEPVGTRRVGAAVASGAAPPAAAEGRPLDLSGERRAKHFLVFGLLVGREHLIEFLGGLFLQRGDLLAGRLAVAVGATGKQALHLFADVRLRSFDRLLLLVGQTQRGGHFRIIEGLRSTLLQGDLLESFELVGREHFGQLLLLGLLDLGELLPPFFGTQVA